MGLGGRLDATNIVDADVAVVTSIALDHTDWLGPDRESIGREKAGIFRAEKPAIVGEPEMPYTIADVAQRVRGDFATLRSGLALCGHGERLVVYGCSWNVGAFAVAAGATT